MASYICYLFPFPYSFPHTLFSKLFAPTRFFLVCYSLNFALAPSGSWFRYVIIYNLFKDVSALQTYKNFPYIHHTPNFVLKAYMWLTFHYSFTCLRMPQEHSLCIGWFSLYPSTYSVPCHTVWTQYLSTDEIGKSIHWNPSAECQPIHPSATTSCPNCLPSAADTPWALRISAYQYLNLPTHKLPRGHQIHSILCWLSPNCLLLSVALRTILIWSSLPSLYSSQ